MSRPYLKKKLEESCKSLDGLYFKPPGIFTNAMLKEDVNITQLLRDAPDAYAVYKGKTAAEIDDNYFNFDANDLLRDTLYSNPISIPLNGQDIVVHTWSELNKYLALKDTVLEDSRRRSLIYTGPQLTPKDYVTLLRFKILKLLEIYPMSEITNEDIEDLYTQSLQYILDCNDLREKIKYYKDSESILLSHSAGIDNSAAIEDLKLEARQEIRNLEEQISALERRKSLR